jgi:hypothetical protein
LDRVFAMLKAGRSNEARMAMIAITTNNSISVNPKMLLWRVFNNWIYRNGGGFGWTVWENRLFTCASLKKVAKNRLTTLSS